MCRTFHEPGKKLGQYCAGASLFFTLHGVDSSRTVQGRAIPDETFFFLNKLHVYKLYRVFCVFFFLLFLFSMAIFWYERDTAEMRYRQYNPIFIRVGVFVSEPDTSLLLDGDKYYPSTANGD